MDGFSKLEEYISEKTQVLYNERVLDSVSIKYTVAEANEDGKYPVDLVINIKDTWNIVAIPRPKYSSNTGFELILKARDYNFLGTMSALRLDIGYSYDNDKRHSMLFGLDSNIPFNVFGLLWYFKFNNFFDYRHKTESPFYYMNTTGLAAEFPIEKTTLRIGFDESFITNEENEDYYKINYGEFQKGFYMSSGPYMLWKIPTGIEVGKYGSLVYTPRISAVINHEFPKWQLNQFRVGPFLTFRHDFGFERVDWIGNFRKGFSVNIDNYFQYDFNKIDTGISQWTGMLQLTGSGYFIFTKIIGMSARFNYRHWFFYEKDYVKAGDYIRGITDKDINADYMFSLNLDLPVRIFRFAPSGWSEHKVKKVFLFDFQLSPFVDMALYHNDKVDFVAAGGLEIFIFPDFFRSLYLRVSMGWNFSKFDPKRNYEIYVGTDFHF